MHRPLGRPRALTRPSPERGTPTVPLLSPDGAIYPRKSGPLTAAGRWPPWPGCPTRQPTGWVLAFGGDGRVRHRSVCEDGSAQWLRH